MDATKKFTGFEKFMMHSILVQIVKFLTYNVKILGMAKRGHGSTRG